MISDADAGECADYKPIYCNVKEAALWIMHLCADRMQPVIQTLPIRLEFHRSSKSELRPTDNRMQPIEVKITGHIPKSSQELCAEFLEMERWPEFKGYSILPGIKCAYFETRSLDLVGSRIRVQNTDGSAHVEEIVEWDVNKRMVLRFEEFDSPLKSFATHFIETWEFRKAGDGTEVMRSMAMYPKGMLGRLMLLPVSRLMKKAFERNLNEAKGTLA